MRQERTRLAKPLLQKIERAEKDMAAWQAEQAACEASGRKESAYLPENKAQLQQYLNKLAEIKVKLGETEELWLSWQDALEDIDRQIQAHTNSIK